MTGNDTEESSPVTKEDSIDAMPETSSTDLEIQDIQGIGPTTAKKLKEGGTVSVMDLAVTSADELAVDINASKESAAAFIMAAQKLLRDSHIIEKEFLTADLALEKPIIKIGHVLAHYQLRVYPCRLKLIPIAVADSMGYTFGPGRPIFEIIIIFIKKLRYSLH